MGFGEVPGVGLYPILMSTEQMVLRNHLCETFGFTPKNSIRMPFLGSRH